MTFAALPMLSGLSLLVNQCLVHFDRADTRFIFGTREEHEEKYEE
jgi:hypothetical protein